MRSQEVEEFRVIASAYCDFIDSSRIFNDEESYRKLLRIISQLFTSALNLPEVELKEKHWVDADVQLPIVEVKHHNMYTEVFDPYHDETPVTGCLEDDIIDIYSDIKKGLILFEQGLIVNAVWEWRFGLEIHWGEHATSAIRALQSIKFS